MTKTTAPSTTPSPAVEQTQPKIDPKKVSAAQNAFFVALFNMSWQLAIVVLLPLIGGAQIDKNLGTSPIFTLLGFAIALGGMTIIVLRQVQSLDPSKTRGKK